MQRFDDISFLIKIKGKTLLVFEFENDFALILHIK